MKFAFYSIFHPVNTYEDIKNKGKGSLFFSALIVAAWFFAAVIERQATNFRFNHNNARDLNVLLILLRTAVLYGMWVISSWGSCTLLSGKGKLPEIAKMTAYALIPLIIAILLKTAASFFLSLNEGIFIWLIMFAGYFWTALLLFIGHMEAHHYEIGQAFVTIIVTFIGILAIIFIVLLIGTIVGQFLGFLRDIAIELLNRI